MSILKAMSDRDDSSSVNEKSGSEVIRLEEERQTYRQYPIRFYGLTMIGLLNIASSLSWLSVAPVPQQASDFFGGTSFSVINWFSNIFMLSFLIFGPVASIVYDRFSIKVGIVIGAALQLVGSWLRFFSVFVNNPSGRLGLAIVGQIVCAIGQPFILAASTPYAALWFSADGRGTATTVSGLTNAVGAAIASLTAPAFVTEESDMKWNFLFIAVLTTAIAIPAFFVPRKPKTPPSYSASDNTRHLPFWPSMRLLFTNYQFVLIWISFGVLCGLYSTVSSLLAQILLPYGISEDEAGYAAVALIIAGIVGAVASGTFIDKTGKHKWVLKSAVPVVGFMYLALLLVIKEDNYVPIVVVCALTGFFTFSLLPVALELSVECSYPVSESISSPLLWFSSQILAFVFTISMDALRDPNGSPPNNMHRALIMATCLSMSMVILAFFYTSKNKRLDSEEAAARNKSHNADPDYA